MPQDLFGEDTTWALIGEPGKHRKPPADYVPPSVRIKRGEKPPPRRREKP